ncbi:MAG: hypothetical protein ACLFVE_11380 [Chitinispirillaceae bacterium]
MDYLLSFIIVSVLVAVLVVLLMKAGGRKRLLCVSCGTVSSIHPKPQGSAAVELILWLCFLVPGLVYTIWRGSRMISQCPKCGSREMIPPDSERGKQILQQIEDRKRAQVPAEMKTCPYCAEPIRAAAKVCRYCSRELEAVL